MMGLMSVGGGTAKGKFLGGGVSVVGNGSITHVEDSEYMSAGTFLKKCRVKILAYTWASNDHQNVYVELSGYGQLISAYDNDLKYLRKVVVERDVDIGTTITAVARGNSSGVSGYSVWLA